jgi:hypothetical protein
MSKIVFETNNMCSFIILGDMNSRIGQLKDFVELDSVDPHVMILPDDYTSDNNIPRVSQDYGTNEFGTLLLDFCKQTGLRILNGRLFNDADIGKYTYIGANGCSVVDYVIASEDILGLFDSFSVQDSNILSDHCIINFSIKINNFETEIVNDSANEKLRYKYKWRAENCAKFQNALQSEHVLHTLNNLKQSLSDIQGKADIDFNLKQFSVLMDEVCSPLFKQTFSGQNKRGGPDKSQNTWFDDDCKIKRDQFYSCLNTYRVDKSNFNRIQMCKARSDYKHVIRSKRYQHRKNKTTELLRCKHNNARKYWQMLSQASNVRTPEKIPADTFAQYFKAINSPDDRFFQADEDILYFTERFLNGEMQVMFEELDSVIGESEILKGIKQLKNNSSGGPDLYLNEFFKNGIDSFMPYLTILFNACLEKGYFPDAWSEGFVVPIYKSGNSSDPNNYRGITLLSVLGKLFTRVLNNRLNDWAENYNVYIESQAGFRKNMGTIDNVFILDGIISHCFNNGERLYCAFVDFRKAFDFVVRDILWYKLIKYGVRGKLLKLIQSMYDNVKSKVKVLNNLSEDFVCHLGVRQGECLSPFLFCMYLNDLEETLILNGVEGIDITMNMKLCVLLYADDIVLFSKTAEGLQNSLNVLSEYCIRWKLTVNVQKTKIMVFRKGGIVPENNVFMYNGHVLEIVNKFKYLGTVFTSGGAYNEHDRMLSGQALKAIFKLKKSLYSFTDISPKHYLELFEKLILPILMYSSEISGFNKGTSSERIQLSFYKQLLGVKISTQNSFVYGELGKFPLHIQRNVNIVKFWLKLCELDENKYCKTVYNMLKSDAERGKTNWVSKVKHLLSINGFYDVWQNQGVDNKKLFLFTFLQRLKDIYTQNWNASLHESTRAIFYRQVSNFDYKQYLDLVKVQKYRMSLTKLRLSSHRLEVECGRWKKPVRTPFDERKCAICKTLEDEFHFVCECVSYNDLRKKYIKPYYWIRPNFEKFINLMKSENTNEVNSLAVFIYKAFERRTQIMNL